MCGRYIVSPYDARIEKGSSLSKSSPAGDTFNSQLSILNSQLSNPTHSVGFDSVRLACVRHAASVRPEPGSNSLIYCIHTPPAYTENV